jgi:hypothetical protein
MMYALSVGGELSHGCNPLNSHVVTIGLRKAKRAEGWRKAGAGGTEGVPRGGEDALPTKEKLEGLVVRSTQIRCATASGEARQ